MLRRRSLVLVAIAIAIPATAQTFGFSVDGTTAACLAIGDASYRIAGPSEHADYTVRIDPAAATPDIRVQLTGTIDDADFVFIEGSGESRCQGGKSVKVDAAAPADLTIGFANSSARPTQARKTRARFSAFSIRRTRCGCCVRSRASRKARCSARWSIWSKASRRRRSVRRPDAFRFSDR